MNYKLFNIEDEPEIESEKHGTVFYETSIDDIIDTLENYDSNLFLMNELQQNGLDAINLHNTLYGSAIIDGMLYICVSDGYNILVNDEEVNPLTALNTYDLNDLSAYIQDTNQDIIHRYITLYEVPVENIESATEYLLKIGYSLKAITSAYNELVEIQK